MRDKQPVENKLSERRRSEIGKRTNETLERVARGPLEMLPGDPDDPMICRGID